jgi:quercetin dioxygenase-like cupin family protein
MATGEEISSHSAPTPAILYFLEGEANVQLGDRTVHAQQGSFVFMPPMLSHAIGATSPVKMLFVQIKVGHSN